MDQQPEKPFIIRDLETLKVISDPLRNQIMDALVHEPLTVKEVATRLGLAPSKLYYHINLLEKHSLIQAVETRVVSNMIEKLYQVSAPKFDIDPALLSFDTPEGKERVYDVFTSIIDSTREDLLRSLQARAYDLERGAQTHPRKVVVNRRTSRLSDERADEFHERLEALLEEFDRAEVNPVSASDDSHTYALTVALYPIFHFPEEE